MLQVILTEQQLPRMVEDLRGKDSIFMTLVQKIPIVYIVDQPLDSRDFNRFRIRDFIDKNYKTKVLDLSRSINKISQCKTDLPKIYDKYIYSNLNKNEILGFLKKIEKNSIVK